MLNRKTLYIHIGAGRTGCTNFAYTSGTHESTISAYKLRYMPDDQNLVFTSKQMIGQNCNLLIILYIKLTRMKNILNFLFLQKDYLLLKYHIFNVYLKY